MNFFDKNTLVGAQIKTLVKKLMLLFLWASPFLSLDVRAQDAAFSQYYASSLYLNPAFAAVEKRITFSSNYRTQWNSFLSSPYVTSQVSLIAPIKLKKASHHIGGIGASVYSNRAGDGNFQTLGASISLGYNVHLSSLHLLSFGVQGGWVQKKIDINGFQWGSQYNQLLGDVDPSKPVNSDMIRASTSFIDFAAGFMYYYNPERDYENKGVSVYFGASAYHLSSPNESLIRDNNSPLPMLIKSHAGLEWNISEKFNFSPNIYFAMQASQQQINTGAYLTYLFGNKEARVAPGFILLGGWYRVHDSMIFSTGVGNNNYTLGFSYDLNRSSLRYTTQGRGAYEISLRVQLGKTKKVTRIYNPLI